MGIERVAKELEEGSALLAGTPYRMIAPLGRGGMGLVVEAEHTGLAKRVVVKLLHRELAGEPRWFERMRIEAQALAHLSHPNLVAITDFGRTADGRPFIAMEKLEGRTLRQEIAERRHLPQAEAVDVVRQVLAGLSVVHSHGIVHRDIKADNVFLCGSPGAPRLVKVLDFGIAKLIEGGEENGPNRPAPSRFPTEDGALLGTPRYLSPEQATARPVDARTDVYGTGILLYAALAGRGPFDHVRGLVELVGAHTSVVPPPPSAFAQQPLDREIEKVVMRALEKRRRPSDLQHRHPRQGSTASRLPTRVDVDFTQPPSPSRRSAYVDPQAPIPTRTR